MKKKVLAAMLVAAMTGSKQWKHFRVSRTG